VGAAVWTAIGLLAVTSLGTLVLPRLEDRLPVCSSRYADRCRIREGWHAIRRDRVSIGRPGIGVRHPLGSTRPTIHQTDPNRSRPESPPPAQLLHMSSSMGWAFPRSVGARRPTGL